MKKFVNDPADVVRDALRGMAAAHPELRVDHENRVLFRADAPVAGQGGDRLRRRVGPRAAARRVRRARDAGRRLRRRGVHVAGARPDARGHQGRRRRGGRPAHREELHRRRPELRDGRRARRRRDRHRGGDGRHRATTSPSRTALHRRPPRGRGNPARGEDRRCGRRGAALPRRRRRGRPPGRARGPQHGRRPDLRDRAGRRAPRPSTCRRARWRWASASTASPAGGGVPMAPRARSPQLLVGPVLEDLDFTGGDGVLAFVNGMGGDAAARAVPHVRRRWPRCSSGPASPSRVRWSARTSPAWTWPGARSPC